MLFAGIGLDIFGELMYFNDVICLLAAAAAELKCASTTKIKIQIQIRNNRALAFVYHCAESLAVQRVVLIVAEYFEQNRLMRDVVDERTRYGHIELYLTHTY